MLSHQEALLTLPVSVHDSGPIIWDIYVPSLGKYDLFFYTALHK